MYFIVLLELITNDSSSSSSSSKSICIYLYKIITNDSTLHRLAKKNPDIVTERSHKSRTTVFHVITGSCLISSMKILYTYVFSSML